MHAGRNAYIGSQNPAPASCILPQKLGFGYHSEMENVILRIPSEQGIGNRNAVKISLYNIYNTTAIRHVGLNNREKFSKILNAPGTYVRIYKKCFSDIMNDMWGVSTGNNTYFKSPVRPGYQCSSQYIK